MNVKHGRHPHWIGCDNRCVDDPTHVQTELDKAYDALQKAIRRAVFGFDVPYEIGDDDASKTGGDK